MAVARVSTRTLKGHPRRNAEDSSSYGFHQPTSLLLRSSSPSSLFFFTLLPMSSSAVPPPDRSVIVSKKRRVRSKEPTPPPPQKRKISPSVPDKPTQPTPASQGPELPNPPWDLEQELLEAPNHANYESWVKSRGADARLRKNVKRLGRSTTSSGLSMYHLKNIFKALSKGSCPFSISVLKEAKKHLDSKDDFRPVAEVVLPKLEEQGWLEARP